MKPLGPPGTDNVVHYFALVEALHRLDEHHRALYGGSLVSVGAHAGRRAH